MLQEAYGHETMCRAQCFEWHSRFKKGRTSLGDNKKSGRPRTSINQNPKMSKKFDKLFALIVELPSKKLLMWLAFHLVQLRQSSQAIWTCITSLPSSSHGPIIGPWFVPRLLTSDQKDCRVNTCKDLCQQANDDLPSMICHNPSFISRIITGNEMWIYGYDP